MQEVLQSFGRSSPAATQTLSSDLVPLRSAKGEGKACATDEDMEVELSTVLTSQTTQWQKIKAIPVMKITLARTLSYPMAAALKTVTVAKVVLVIQKERIWTQLVMVQVRNLDQKQRLRMLKRECWI